MNDHTPIGKTMNVAVATKEDAKYVSGRRASSSTATLGSPTGPIDSCVLRYLGREGHVAADRLARAQVPGAVGLYAQRLVDLEFADRKVRIQAGKSIMIPGDTPRTRRARPTLSNCWRSRCRPIWEPSPALLRRGVNFSARPRPHARGMAESDRTQGIAEALSLFDASAEGTARLPGVEGHRARLRTRLLAAGPDALADHEMLEIVLFALPRRDTEPLARVLLARFGSFSG